MTTRSMAIAALSAALTVATLWTVTPSPASAEPPARDSGRFTETFADDLILDLCGIETTTTVTQRWSVQLLRDGIEMVHIERTFVSEDPRIPIERAAGVTFNAPDGSRVVIGMPLQLVVPGEGVRIVDAGLVQFDPSGEVTVMHGGHPFLAADLAALYCPT